MQSGKRFQKLRYLQGFSSSFPPIYSIKKFFLLVCLLMTHARPEEGVKGGKGNHVPSSLSLLFRENSKEELFILSS